MEFDAKIVFDISRQDQIYIEEYCQKNSLTFGKFLAELLQNHRAPSLESNEPKPPRKRTRKSV